MVQPVLSGILCCARDGSSLNSRSSLFSCSVPSSLTSNDHNPCALSPTCTSDPSGQPLQEPPPPCIRRSTLDLPWVLFFILLNGKLTLEHIPFPFSSGVRVPTCVTRTERPSLSRSTRFHWWVDVTSTLGSVWRDRLKSLIQWVSVTSYVKEIKKGRKERK